MVGCQIMAAEGDAAQLREKQLRSSHQLWPQIAGYRQCPVTPLPEHEFRRATMLVVQAHGKNTWRRVGRMTGLLEQCFVECPGLIESGLRVRLRSYPAAHGWFGERVDHILESAGRAAGGAFQVNAEGELGKSDNYPAFAVADAGIPAWRKMRMLRPALTPRIP